MYYIHHTSKYAIDNPDMDAKIMYWSDCISYVVVVAIPKKRGKGFLKSPVGHHHNDLSLFLSFDLSVDCCGLDGYLSLNMRANDKSYAEMCEFMDKISEHTGFKHQLVTSDAFYRIVKETLNIIY